MGHCSCCPLLPTRKPSVDSLSLGTEHPSIEVQMPPVGVLAKRTKKIDSKQLTILKKQESAYFKQTHRLRLDTDAVNSNAIPLLNPLPAHPQKNNPAQDHTSSMPRGGEMLSISLAKSKLRPHLQKTSTMDEEETSRENYFNNREDFSQSGREDSLREEQFDGSESRGNLTFSGRREAVLLGKQFRTNVHHPLFKQEEGETKQYLEAALKQQGLSPQAKCGLFLKFAKRHLQEGNSSSAKQALYQANELLKDVNAAQLKFQTLSLYGCVLLELSSAAQAVSILMKAMRLQVARQGVESVRLVQVHYWLGEGYFKSLRGTLAKEYLLKAIRGYSFHGLKDAPLLMKMHLRLGEVYHSQEEFPQADKHYARGIKASQQEKHQHIDDYLELLLRRAENYNAMESYRLAVGTFASAFKTIRRHNLTNTTFYSQLKTSLCSVLAGVVQACISQSQLLTVIKLAEQCQQSLPQVIALQTRLKKMRAILYREVSC